MQTRRLRGAMKLWLSDPERRRPDVCDRAAGVSRAHAQMPDAAGWRNAPVVAKAAGHEHCGRALGPALGEPEDTSHHRGAVAGEHDGKLRSHQETPVLCTPDAVVPGSFAWQTAAGSGAWGARAAAPTLALTAAWRSLSGDERCEFVEGGVPPGFGVASAVRVGPVAERDARLGAVVVELHACDRGLVHADLRYRVRA